MNAPLELRDIHLPPEPSWWPPAPGWWLLALLVLAAIAWLVVAAVRWRRARRRRALLQAEFDAAARVTEPQRRAAAISELLRRAARLRDPAAAALRGEAWLEFLDGVAPDAPRAFSTGPGRALLDAPYRPQVDAARVDALLAPARERYERLVGIT